MKYINFSDKELGFEMYLVLDNKEFKGRNGLQGHKVTSKENLNGFSKMGASKDYPEGQGWYCRLIKD